MKTSTLLAGIAAITFASAGTAGAALTIASSAWPPVLDPTGAAGYTLSGPTPTFITGGVTVTLNSALLRTIAPINIVPAGANEIANFSANMDAVGDVIPLATNVPSSSSGAGSMVTFGKAGNVTGTFNTEMLALNLSGTTALGPFMLRESPTLVSPGSTTITNLNGTLFRIDSFFDVFTELSLDGGATWAPNTNGPMRMTLQGVPEPTAAAFAGLAALGLLRRRRA